MSAEHDVVLHSKYRGMYKIPMHELIEKHNRLKYGIDDSFITTFDYSGSGISYTDDEIRLICAIVCDGSFKTDGKTNWCRINLKKQRKKERLTMLLNKCDIEYKECDKENGYTVYKFNAPIRMKNSLVNGITVPNIKLRLLLMKLLNGMVIFLIKKVEWSNGAFQQLTKIMPILFNFV